MTELGFLLGWLVLDVLLLVILDLTAGPEEVNVVLSKRICLRIRSVFRPMNDRRYIEDVLKGLRGDP